MRDKAKQAILTAQGICLHFGGIQALWDVGFEVGNREILGVVGPNGSGKTCVLNVISGFYRPQRGEVLVDGVPITSMAPHRIARMGVGRSFQQMELFSGMSVLQSLLVGCHSLAKGNLFSAGIYWGPGRKSELRLREMVEEVLDFMELERYRKAPADSLPIGTQKLVGVARALCARPKILLLDEPSCGLSFDEKKDLARFLLRIKHERGIPIVWVEHDLILVGDLSDRLIVLDQGIKVAEGTHAEIWDNSKVVEIFGGKTGEYETAVSHRPLIESDPGKEGRASP
ncbi:MAG: ABC transporter ATP-binding protein [Thermodesulfobacteriota bacterium]